MRAYERLIKYARIHTASRDGAAQTPSTACQFDLSRLLAGEMREMGMESVHEDENAYVYGFLPASEGMEQKPCVGFIAHIDTAPDFNGDKVKPRVIENYDGGEVKLGHSGRSLSPEQFPELADLKGRTLICTDGESLLGADDKAGIAEIMTACEKIIDEKLPHGPIAVCFTPDEETGHGAALLDRKRLGADFAFTIDGEAVNEINYETFNAASAHWEVKGLNVHPGSAKDTMINAALVAMEINAMLPAGDVPGRTEGYEGFFHLTDMKGSVERAALDYIVRDHDEHSFLARKNTLRHIEKCINEKYGPGTAVLTISDEYRNMALPLKEHMDIVALAKGAVEKAGLRPVTAPVRGGTDGAQLSFRGLLCPNLGTGGYAFHGPFEHICAEDMDRAVEIILNIVSGNLR